MSLFAYIGSVVLALIAGVIISPWARDAWRQLLHPAHERQHREPDPFAWMAAGDGLPPAQPVLQRDVITAPRLAVPDAQVAAHADSMWQASEEYLPPAPETQPYLTAEEWQRYCNAGRAVEPVRTGEHPPWTGEIPALTPEAEAAEQDRQWYIKAHLAEAAGMTDDEVRAAMRDALGSLRKPAVTESVSAWRPGAVTAEGERLASVTLP